MLDKSACWHSLFQVRTLVYMDLQGLFGVLCGATLRAGVGEGVGIVLALYVIPHVHNGLVGELEADATGGDIHIVPRHELGEIFRAGKNALNKNYVLPAAFLQRRTWFCRAFFVLRTLPHTGQG